MRILITHNYFLSLDPKQFQTQSPYLPLGTLYAASYLRKQGHSITFADTQFESDADFIKRFINNPKPDLFIIYEDGFNYLNKMCLTNMRMETLRMIDLVKKHNIPVIVSASDASDHPEIYLNAGADFIIMGEGEITLGELCDSIQNNLPTKENIRGIAFLLKEKIIKTESRTVLQDLDTLPDPAWDLVDVKPYKKAWNEKHGYYSINLVTTRGCPFKCNWCAKPIYGNRYNCHSPERIAFQMQEVYKLFTPEHIWFADDIFGLKPNWIELFDANLKKLNIKIPYKIQSRADLIEDEKTVIALYESGCETVWMGAESGSQKILDAMDKGIRIEQIKTAAQFLKKYNIKTGLFIQFGYPGETIDDIRDTISLILQIMPEEIGISVSYPLPGTKFYEKVKNELSSKKNWSDSDDLALMFSGNYPPEFYKTLHRFVHPYFRFHQCLNSKKTFSFKKIVRLPYYFFKYKAAFKILTKTVPDAEKLL